MSATIVSSYLPSTKEKEAPTAPQKIDENRILANGAVGFFTALMPLIALAGLTEQTLYLAFLGAFIQGGLSAAQEYKKETERLASSPPFLLVF